MRKSTLTIPEIALIGGTRAALGAGLALLLGDRLEPKQRRAVGWTLLLVGVVTTLPLALDVLSKKPGAQRPRGA
jgi:4-amino-4-deoxy-L-arabinose transferase-like glycosyltransferase